VYFLLLCESDDEPLLVSEPLESDALLELVENEQPCNTSTLLRIVNSKMLDLVMGVFINSEGVLSRKAVSV
jgi:hypothetical protein